MKLESSSWTYIYSLSQNDAGTFKFNTPLDIMNRKMK